MNPPVSVTASESVHELSEASAQLIRELRESQMGSIRKGSTARQKIVLGRSPDYLSGWDSKSAFKELYQNWYVPTATARRCS